MPDSIRVGERLLYGGESVFAALGKHATQRLRVEIGFCPFDDAETGDVRRIAPGSFMCAECAAKTKAADDEFEAAIANKHGE